MTAATARWAYHACIVCLALMIVVPPLNPFHLVPLPAFIEEWLALAFGTAAAALAIWARRLRLDQVPRIVPWLVGFVVVLAAQAAGRDLPYREQALLPALYLLWAIALAWVGLVLRQELGAERTARTLACCVLAVACVSAAFAMIQASGADTPVNWLVSRPQSPRAYANLNQPNLLANLLALGAVSAVFLHSSGVLGSAAGAATLVLLAFAMVLTGSRTSLVFIAWMLAWALWWARSSAADVSRKAVRLAVFALVAFLAAQGLLSLLGMNPQSMAITRTMGWGFAEEGPTSLAARRYIWLQAAHMFAGSPLVGVGPGMFSWNFFLNSAAFGDTPGVERLAHDFVLQLLAETGLAGAALVIVPLALWFASNRRPQAEPWRWWCVAFAGVGVLHSLVENPLWYAHFLGTFALVLGIGDRAAYTIKRGRILRIVAPALVLVGVLTLASAAAGYRQTIAWLRGAGANATLESMQRSILRPYAEVLASTVSIHSDRFDPADVALSERLVRFMPIDLAVYRHIRLLSQAGRAEEARALLERAVIAYPDTLGDLRNELDAARESPEARELLRALNGRFGK